MSKPFDLFWGTVGSAGEAGDVARTVEDVRTALCSDSAAKVRLRVGTRGFGDKVLARLEEEELARVTVILGGDHG